MVDIYHFYLDQNNKREIEEKTCKNWRKYLPYFGRPKRKKGRKRR